MLTPVHNNDLILGLLVLEPKEADTTDIYEEINALNLSSV